MSDMTLSATSPRGAHRAPSVTRTGLRAAAAVVLLTTGSGGLLLAASTASAAAVPVPLGTATSFAVIAGTTVTSATPSTVSGDIGLSPGTSVTGAFVQTNGTQHVNNTVAQNAQTDLTAAYLDAAAQSPTTSVVGNLSGQTLGPGVYGSTSSLLLSGTVPLTLDGANNPSSVFVIKAGSTLTTGTGSSIVLTRGAQACNVFFQVGSSATLGTSSTFQGSVLALESITATTGATVVGRLLARNGAVTLDGNTITRPSCAAAVPGDSATPTATVSPVPTTSGSPAPTTSPSPPTATVSPAPTTPGSPAPTTAPSPPTGPAVLEGSPPAPVAPPRDDSSTDGQVSRVPSGGVPAGDGSLLTAGSGPLDAPRGPLALTVALLGATAVLRSRVHTR